MVPLDVHVVDLEDFVVVEAQEDAELVFAVQEAADVEDLEDADAEDLEAADSTVVVVALVSEVAQFMVQDLMDQELDMLDQPKLVVDVYAADNHKTFIYQFLFKQF